MMKLPSLFPATKPADRPVEQQAVRKKVVHLRSTFHAGGTENLIVHLFNTPSTTFQLTLVLMKPGPLMHSLNSTLNSARHIYRTRKMDLSFLRKLMRIVAEERPDCIHTHQEIELFYALLVKLFFPRIKLFHQVHLYNPKANLEYLLEKFAVRLFVHRLLAPSQSLKQQLSDRGYPPEKMAVLHNIVQRASYLSEDDKERFLRRVGLREGETLIGMIGNFVPEKDQLTLARAFKILMEDFPSAKLIFIGKGSPKQQACEQVFAPESLEKRVFFTGPWNYASELIPFFGVSVFSSRQETFGMAAIESLLYEVPLIASDIPVMRELSENGRYFDLFETGNPEDLARRLRQRLAQPAEKKQLEAARVYAEKAFNPESYIHKLGQIYHQ